MIRWGLFAGSLALALVFLFSPKGSQDLQSESSMESKKIPSPSPRKEQKKGTVPHNAQEVLFESLPRNSELANLADEELHHTPQVILDKATVLDKVEQMMVRDAAKIADGKIFYRECALESQLVDAIRMLCLQRLRKWTIASEGRPLDESIFPERLAKLSKIFQ